MVTRIVQLYYFSPDDLLHLFSCYHSIKDASALLEFQLIQYERFYGRV